MDNIRTKWHHVIGAIRADRLSFDIGKMSDWPYRTSELMTENSAKVLSDHIHAVEDAPKFFIGDELMKRDIHQAMLGSLEAMVKAKVDHLPYPMMLVEMNAWSEVLIKAEDDPSFTSRSQRKVRDFVLLAEREIWQPLLAGWHFKEEWAEERLKEAQFMAIPMVLIQDGPEDFVIVPGAYFFVEITERGFSPAGPTVEYDELEDSINFHFTTIPAPYLNLKHPGANKLQSSALTNMKQAVGRAIMVALVLMNTRGIEKEVIDPQRLNRARAKLGKTPIPKHHVIKIGHVYNRAGQRVAMPNDEAKRRSMPIHLRRAHYIGVRYGKGKTEIRYDFRPSVLVNYKSDGGEAPRLSPEVEVHW